ncbi:MAG: hypothetical protein ABSB49_18465 [Polyangia bacterium]|jgi:hypothetical protein
MNAPPWLFGLQTLAKGFAQIELKKGTIRPIDHQDAAMLRQAFNLEDDGP